MSNNKHLMEAILARLKSLIVMMEPGETEQLEKLVNMACEVSNQLIRIENGELINRESEDESEDEENNDEDDEEIEEDEQE